MHIMIQWFAWIQVVASGELREMREASKSGPACLLGYYRPALTGPVGISLDAVREVLAGGRTSRLIKGLVLTGQALSAQIVTQYPGAKHAGMMMAYGVPGPGKAVLLSALSLLRLLVNLAMQMTFHCYLSVHWSRMNCHVCDLDVAILLGRSVDDLAVDLRAQLARFADYGVTEQELNKLKKVGRPWPSLCWCHWIMCIPVDSYEGNEELLFGLFRANLLIIYIEEESLGGCYFGEYELELHSRASQQHTDSFWSKGTVVDRCFFLLAVDAIGSLPSCTQQLVTRCFFMCLQHIGRQLAFDARGARCCGEINDWAVAADCDGSISWQQLLQWVCTPIGCAGWQGLNRIRSYLISLIRGVPRSIYGGHALWMWRISGMVTCNQVLTQGEIDSRQQQSRWIPDSRFHT